MELTMKDLEQCFKDAITTDSLFIGVKVQAPESPCAEIIINPSENFEAKLAYYKRAYNEDLTLKAFDKIRIVNFALGDCYDDIECYFEGTDI